MIFTPNTQGRLQVSQDELRNHLTKGFSYQRSYSNAAATARVRDYTTRFMQNLTMKCPKGEVHHQTLDAYHNKYGNGSSSDVMVYILVLIDFYFNLLPRKFVEQETYKAPHN